MNTLKPTQEELECIYKHVEAKLGNYNFTKHQIRVALYNYVERSKEKSINIDVIKRLALAKRSYDEWLNAPIGVELDFNAYAWSDIINNRRNAFSSFESDFFIEE